MKWKCKDCEYWVEWTHVLEETLEKNPDLRDRGDCHINPPVAGGTSEQAYTFWPDTKAYEGCAKIKLTKEAQARKE